MRPDEALAAAHADARTRIEAARTLLRMAVMFPERMSAKEAVEEALTELDGVTTIAVLLREVPVEVPYAQLPEPQVAIRGLTEHQGKILGLVAQGYSNNEIGEQLHLSGFTIKSHLARIFKVLNVHTRAEAVAKAMELRVNVSDTGTY